MNTETPATETPATETPVENLSKPVQEKLEKKITHAYNKKPKENQKESKENFFDFSIFFGALVGFFVFCWFFFSKKRRAGVTERKKIVESLSNSNGNSMNNKDLMTEFFLNND